MKKKLSLLLLIGITTLAVGSSYAKQQPPDPNKKRPGEECSRDDECQKHHSCKKTGDKGICTAPPRPKLPPGAVT
jgi:hypothetical protein